MNEQEAKQPKKWLIPALCIAAAVLTVALVWWAVADPAEPAGGTTAPTNPKNMQLDANSSIDLGKGLKIISTGAYNGVFWETGKLRDVTAVQMIQLVNQSELVLRNARIVLEYADGTAVFEVSFLAPGAKAVVLELSGMGYQSAKPTSAEAQDVAFIKEMPMQKDRLEAKVVEGGIELTNIGTAAIQEDIYVYFKHARDDIFHGGYTGMTKLDGGLAAGQSQLLPMQPPEDLEYEVVMITLAAKS